MGTKLTATGRVSFSIALVLAGALAVFTTLAYALTVQGLQQILDRNLHRETHAYAGAMASAPTQQGLVEATRGYLRERATADAGSNPILIASFADGRVLSNSAVKLEVADPSLVTTAAASSRGTVSTLTYQNIDYRIASAPILSSSGAHLGVFIAALRADANNDTAGEVARVLGGAALLVFGLGLAVSLAVSRASMKPLRRMAADAATITHRSPIYGIAYDGPADELGSLAASLNGMLERLRDGAEEQRRFVADASHELRTPLAVIRGTAEVALADGSSDAERRDALGQVVAESIRMNRLVDDLLALAQLDESSSTNPQPLSVDILLEETAARVRAQFPAVEAVHTPSCPGLWIEADPDHVERALINLARNAARASGDGGTVRLSCQRVDSSVSIHVDDSGPGIASEDIDRVFDRFFRGSAERSASAQDGAGLGLAITRRLVELQGGTVSAENTTNGGARFTIRLALAPTPEGAE